VAVGVEMVDDDEFVTLHLRESSQEAAIVLSDHGATGKLQSKSLESGVRPDEAEDLVQLRVFDESALCNLSRKASCAIVWGIRELERDVLEVADLH
jgi:hypothetical protein